MGSSPSGQIYDPRTAIGTSTTSLTTSGSITSNNGITIAVGNLVVTAGNIVFSAASAKIVPGATSLLIRNNADSASNIAITDAGGVTVRAGLTVTASGITVTSGSVVITSGGLQFTAASSKIIAGATSLLIRDTGDANTNVTITDAGATTVRGAITPTGGVAAAGGFTATPCGQIHTAGAPARVSTDGTELTPTTTTVYTVEIFVPCNMTLTGVNHFNGSAVTGNITVALYTSAGVAIAAAVSAATAGSGTDAYQAIPFATPYAAVGPAKYLIGFQYSSASARPNCHLIGTGFGIAQTSATIGVTAISPVPTAFVATTQPIAALY